MRKKTQPSLKMWPNLEILKILQQTKPHSDLQLLKTTLARGCNWYKKLLELTLINYNNLIIIRF